jgi:hypothetical protein
MTTPKINNAAAIAVKMAALPHVESAAYYLKLYHWRQYNDLSSKPYLAGRAVIALFAQTRPLTT